MQRRPSLATIRARYQELVQDGAPKHLGVYERVYPPDEVATASVTPAECRGPLGRRCHRVNFCLWCREQRRRENAVKVARIHVGQSNIHRISVQLGTGGASRSWHDVGLMRRIRRLLGNHRFDNVSLWLHPFGENPFEGPKAHIEGVISGWDANPDILDVARKGGMGLLLRRLDGLGAHVPPIQIERLHPHSGKHVYQLVAAGLDIGKPSFPIRRIHAGLYRDHRRALRCRLTDVHGTSRPTHIRDLPCPSDDHLPDATERDIIAAAWVAEEWRANASKAMLSRRTELDDEMSQLVADALPWLGH